MAFLTINTSNIQLVIIIFSMQQCSVYSQCFITVPKLHYLGATEQSNQSILIVWDLQYSGGSPIVSFEIHVILQEYRAKRASPDLIYHVSVDSGQLVTRSLQSGHSYIVMATLYNSLGSSDEYVNGTCVYIISSDFDITFNPMQCTSDLETTCFVILRRLIASGN